jgi:hypothetical protein
MMAQQELNRNAENASDAMQCNGKSEEKKHNKERRYSTVDENENEMEEANARLI